MDLRAWSIVGLLCGVLGSFFLSYDLLGSERGPLRRALAALFVFAVGVAEWFAISLALRPGGLLPAPAWSESTVIWLILISAASVMSALIYSPKGDIGVKARNVALAEVAVLAAVAALILVLSIVFNSHAPYQNSLELVLVLALFLLGTVTLGIFIGSYLSPISAKLGDKTLGSVGAGLTLVAFLIQLVIEVVKP